MNNNFFFDIVCYNIDDEYKMDLICFVYVKSVLKILVIRIFFLLMLIYGFKII